MNMKNKTFNNIRRFVLQGLFTYIFRRICAITNIITGNRGGNGPIDAVGSSCDATS